MQKATLVLLVPGDRLTGLLTENGLKGYGYEVLVASSPSEALEHLRSHKRFHVLVVDADLPNGLALARAGRAANPDLAIVYTARVPHRLSDPEKVSGAPCLRAPFHPHQLAGVIGGLLRRPTADPDEHAA